MEKETVFRCLQQFRKKYSGTAVVSLVAPFTEDCVFSEIEQSDRIRSDVASGAVIVGSIDKFTHLHSFLDFFHHIKRFLIGICMCDSDDLVFRVFDRFTEKTNQSFKTALRPRTFL